jgi:hypothetical protein
VPSLGILPLGERELLESVGIFPDMGGLVWLIDENGVVAEGIGRKKIGIVAIGQLLVQLFAKHL